MGHPGRQPADGGELLVVLHLGEDRHAAFVAGLQASHQMLHQQVRDQNDDGDAAAEDQQQFAAQGRPGFVDVQGGLDRQEHEVRARQAGIGHHEVLSAVILPGPHRGLEGLGRQGQGQLVQHLAVETGVGLEDAPAVTEEGVGVLHQAHGGHQAFQPGGVDGHAQGPFPAALFHAVHGDDHVREAAQPQEDIADVAALDLGLAEPGLPGVVGVLELVGAHIGHLPPVHVHQAHVHEALELALERQEDAVEGLLVGQIVKAVGMGDQADGGGPLAEEKLQRGLRFAHHGVERVFHLPFQGAHVLGVVDAGEDQQRRHRHRDHQDGHDAPQ